MKCPYCDSDIRDDSAYCEKCGMPLNMIVKKRTVRKPVVVQPLEVEQVPGSTCPHCGAALMDCVPLVKTNVTSSGGGYGFFSGCCGVILLGPLGLLCGLRKRKTTSSSQTWWVCRKCGKEFLQREAAKEYVDTAIFGGATTTFTIVMIWRIIFDVFGSNRWVRDIALLMIVGIWLAVPEGINQATGYTIKQLLNDDERIDFYKQCALYGIGSLVLGAIISAKVMEYFLS